jgi:SAM-dependent methyltransferase
MSAKPFSEACERNKEPILAHLRTHFANAASVLELGSGSGQHAVHFAAAMPHLIWQPSDVATQLDGVRAWLRDQPLSNIRDPIALDIFDESSWPARKFDAIFSANTLHIVSWPGVEAIFHGISRCLAPRGILAIYGPFNYGGTYTSESNAAFDGWLHRRDPASGIRDVEAVHALAKTAGLTAASDHSMPANNRLLVWRQRRRVD